MLRAAALRRCRPESSRRLARSSAVLCAALTALLLQSLAPPGYMHGSIESGWPVMLCPEGLPAGFLASVHGHHEHHLHHDDSSTREAGLSEHCPLGGVLDHAAPALPATVNADVAVTQPSSVSHYTAPRLAPRLRANHTRAPPIPA